MRKNSKYQKIVEAAKIADDSIVFFWQKMIDLDEQQQHFLRVNDQEGFKDTENQKGRMIWRIQWEEDNIKKLEDKKELIKEEKNKVVISQKYEEAAKLRDEEKNVN